VFGHLPISFNDQVLRPREWTVSQSVWAAELLRAHGRSSRVLELCAGAGQIGLLALALAEPSRHCLVAVDMNPAACAFARRNAEAAGLGTRVEVREGPMDEVVAAGELFAIVIADPPWVERERIALFPDDPEAAIDGGADGLELARSCVRLAEEHLITDGSLLLQLGSRDQLDRIRKELPEIAPSLEVLDAWAHPGSGLLAHLRKSGFA
jgi:release factor glutamine methyltransferase